MDDLRRVLMRQRSSVAQNDSAGIEDCVDAMGRALHTLQEARGRRVALVKLMTGGEGKSLADVPRLLGEPLPDLVAVAKERVRQAASAVAREAAINQHVIRRSLDAGEAFIQRLFSGCGSLKPVYDRADAHGDGSCSTAMLVNRRV
jgi:hypothetical protein